MSPQAGITRLSCKIGYLLTSNPANQSTAPNSSRPASTVVPGQLACGAIRRAVEASNHNQRAMSKPTVTLTRNLSSPAAIGTVITAIAHDDHSARLGTCWAYT